MALVCGCGTVHVKTYVTEREQTRTYRTFGFAQPIKNFDPAVFSPEHQTAIRDAISEALKKHGLRPASHADLEIGFYLRTQRKQFDLEHPTAQGDTLPDIMSSYYGFVVGSGQSLNQKSPIRYKEGTIIVYVVDGKTHEVIWKGVAKGAVHPKETQEVVNKRIDEAVGKMFQRWPR